MHLLRENRSGSVQSCAPSLLQGQHAADGSDGQPVEAARVLTHEVVQARCVLAKCRHPVATSGACTLLCVL